MVVAAMDKVSPGGIIRWSKIRALAGELAQRLQFKGRLEAPARTNSGGNQQKLVVGKWVATGADILIFDEPTRGIDIGAKVEVYRLIQSLAAEGAAIILVSSELPELMNVAHRIIVMSGGRIQDEMVHEEFEEHRILAAAFAAHMSEATAAE
jgi:ABC-type sugar transport system ATPase subunit